METLQGAGGLGPFQLSRPFRGSFNFMDSSRDSGPQTCQFSTTKSSVRNFRRTQLSLNLCPSSEILAEEKARLRWFVQICNFAAPNNKKSFNLRGFIQENTSTKHPLSIEASNIKPLAIMVLKRQTGSMDSFHASCSLGLKGPHFIHLFKLQISHNPHTGLQPNRRGAWFIHETTLTSQPGRERLLS